MEGSWVVVVLLLCAKLGFSQILDALYDAFGIFRLPAAITPQ